MPISKIEIRKGWHGPNSVRAAQRICDYDIQSSVVGQRGPGFYLWADCIHAKSLAAEWSERTWQSPYSSNLADTRIILLVELHVASNRILDACREEVVAEVLRLSEALGIQDKNLRVVSSLYATFFNQYAEVHGISIQLIICQVFPPKDAYPAFMLGLPLCYIVKDVGIIDNVEPYERNGEGKWQLIPLGKLAKL